MAICANSSTVSDSFECNVKPAGELLTLRKTKFWFIKHPFCIEINCNTVTNICPNYLVFLVALLLQYIASRSLSEL